MPRPTEVKARPDYRIWIRYDDGVTGEVDLAHLAGRGVFAAWDDPEFFAAVHIDESGAVSWGETLDLCPDALYMKLTGKPAEEVLPGLKGAKVDA